jgi:hypothetical protein
MIRVESPVIVALLGPSRKCDADRDIEEPNPEVAKSENQNLSREALNQIDTL